MFIRKVLVKQHRLQVLPGWNTVMQPSCNITALTHGRAILTTEKVEPRMEAYQTLPARLGEVMPQHLLRYLGSDCTIATLIIF